MTRCGTCGHRFQPSPARAQFCSNRCSGIARQHRIFRPCPGCGEIVVRAWSLRDRLYCTRECRGRAALITFECENCGERAARHQSVGTHRFCGDPCRLAWFSRAFVAEASPHWLGGAIDYYGPSWRPAQRAVRERDQVCQDCGDPPTVEALSVAHIIPFRAFGLARHAEANALENLRALCRPCHLIFDHAVGPRVLERMA